MIQCIYIQNIFPFFTFKCLELAKLFIIKEPTRNEGSEGSEYLQGPLNQMKLRDPVFRAALEEHKNTCLEMGYDIADINEAIDDLRNMGKLTNF